MKMFNAPISSGIRRAAIAMPLDESERGQSARLLEGELIDLYVAMLIVVPAAILLKSLWF
jgi:hypothetical protein